MQWSYDDVRTLPRAVYETLVDLVNAQQDVA